MSELLTLREFLAEPWPRTEKIVDPWLPTSGICMLWGERGGGKTLVTLALALHVAEGKNFLEMLVPKPRRVLYIDGEMAADEVKGRLQKLLGGMGPWSEAMWERFAIVSHESFKTGIPDLSEPGRGRRLIEAYVKEHKVELLILDNLSSLLQTGNENEAEGWIDFNHWLLNFRRERVTVLLIHHAGKSGTQRGTSKREDHLNSSVKIITRETEPTLRIGWEYTKWRSFNPEPFELEALFNKTNGKENTATIQRVQSMADEINEVMALQADGLSVRKIAEQIGQSKSKVQRLSRRGKGDTRSSNQL